MEEEMSEQIQSKYNSAMAQLYRLDALWNSAHKHALAGNFNSYKFTLDRIWVELAPDCSKKQIAVKNKYIGLLGKISKILRKIESIKTPEENQGNIKREERITRSKYYSALQRYEIFLRRVLNSQGKGSAYRDVTSEEIE